MTNKERDLGLNVISYSRPNSPYGLGMSFNSNPLGEICDMDISRRGEKGTIPIRGNRLVNNGKEWYFLCRESGPCGPFKSRKGAETALVRYLSSMQKSETGPTFIKLFESG